jgi:exodeoxyribonuclease VII small subunit
MSAADEQRPSRAGNAAPLKIEEALERLEAIAGDLEDGDLDLEQALASFREARRLYGYCLTRLGEAEREVRVLMADGALAAGDQDEGLALPGEGDE